MFHLPGGQLIALGRLFGLLATFSILLEVLLIGRIPFIEESFDLHENMELHRLNGYLMLLSISAHIVFFVIGYGVGGHLGWWPQFLQLNTQFEDVFKATIGTMIFFAATAVSVQAVRKRMRYEIWFLSHLTIYAAVLLTFLHQVNSGGDFVKQQWFVAYWYMLYLLVFGLLGIYRFIRPLYITLKHRFKVSEIVSEGEGIYSIYVTGRNIEQYAFRPGQYATWWFIAPGMWWEGHPFSFSVAPQKDRLRLTAKAGSGDFSAKLQNLAVGTPVIIDGPRGAFTLERATSPDILLIAGGIGVAPYLSYIDQLIGEGKRVTLLYAVRHPKQIAFRNELAALQGRGLRIEVYVSGNNRYIDQAAIAPFVGPNTVAYICGPDGMSKDIETLLKHNGFPQKRIISERFAF